MIHLRRGRVLDRCWLLFGAILGAIVPMAAFGAHWIFGVIFSTWTVRIWPTSIILMVLDTANPPKWGWVFLIWSIAILSNIVLYTIAFALLSMASYPIRRLL